MKLISLTWLATAVSLQSVAQNVGIGTSSPTEKLEVSGNIKSSATVKANTIQFNAPRTYYYSISGADFVAKNSSDEIHREETSNGGAYFISSSLGMTAPVHLPQGATVTKMTVYYVDESLPVTLQVMLRMNTGYNIVASVTTFGTPGEASIVDNSISNAVIDNSAHAYVIDATPSGGAWPGINLTVRRVIIEYQLSQL